MREDGAEARRGGSAQGRKRARAEARRGGTVAARLRRLRPREPVDRLKVVLPDVVADGRAVVAVGAVARVSRDVRHGLHAERFRLPRLVEDELHLTAAGGAAACRG